MTENKETLNDFSIEDRKLALAQLKVLELMRRLNRKSIIDATDPVIDDRFLGYSEAITDCLEIMSKILR